MKRVLILCTGNSARSQIAEGLFRALGGDRVEVFSAGTHPAGFVHPQAVQTMRERGIDISGQVSKSMDLYLEEEFDYVITVCDEANQVCPVFPGPHKRLHWSTPDPSFITGDEETRKTAFRTTVARLEQKVKDLLSEIEKRNTEIRSQKSETKN